jgi:hypothetical protein
MSVQPSLFEQPAAPCPARLPPGLRHQPELIDAAQETALVKRIQALPSPRSNSRATSVIAAWCRSAGLMTSLGRCWKRPNRCPTFCCRYARPSRPSRAMIRRLSAKHGAGIHAGGRHWAPRPSAIGPDRRGFPDGILPVAPATQGRRELGARHCANHAAFGLSARRPGPHRLGTFHSPRRSRPLLGHLPHLSVRRRPASGQGNALASVGARGAGAANPPGIHRRYATRKSSIKGLAKASNRPAALTGTRTCRPPQNLPTAPPVMATSNCI